MHEFAMTLTKSLLNAWVCYDDNKESTKMYEFAMTLTKSLL